MRPKYLTPDEVKRQADQWQLSKRTIAALAALNLGFGTYHQFFVRAFGVPHRYPNNINKVQALQVLAEMSERINSGALQLDEESRRDFPHYFSTDVVIDDHRSSTASDTSNAHEPSSALSTRPAKAAASLEKWQQVGSTDTTFLFPETLNSLVDEWTRSSRILAAVDAIMWGVGSIPDFFTNAFGSVDAVPNGYTHLQIIQALSEIVERVNNGQLTINASVRGQFPQFYRSSGQAGQSD